MRISNPLFPCNYSWNRDFRAREFIIRDDWHVYVFATLVSLLCWNRIDIRPIFNDPPSIYAIVYKRVHTSRINQKHI